MPRSPPPSNGAASDVPGPFSAAPRSAVEQLRGMQGLLLPLAPARRLLGRPASRAFFRRLFIKVEPTPNPDSLKFQPEKRLVLHERFGVGIHFDRSNNSSAAASKLAKKLLKSSAVTGVFMGRDFVSVNKTEEASWAVSRRSAWLQCTNRAE